LLKCKIVFGFKKNSFFNLYLKEFIWLLATLVQMFLGNWHPTSFTILIGDTTRSVYWKLKNNEIYKFMEK